MTDLEIRRVARDSLFLLADIRIEQQAQTHRVRVRNLSDAGMMGEGNLKVQRGHRVEIELRNIGKICGSVAWVQDDRFGIAFDEEVDSQQARYPLAAGDEANGLIVRRSWPARTQRPVQPHLLRKV